MEGGGLLAKFFGAIGYALQVDSGTGIVTDEVVEKKYRGDVLTNNRRYQSGDKVNDDIELDNSISIVADAYAYSNLGFMKYVVLDGVAWKIKSFSISRPRIVLQIGEVYNGERPALPTE